jgi:hypothetical protein
MTLRNRAGFRSGIEGVVGGILFSKGFPKEGVFQSEGYLECFFRVLCRVLFKGSFFRVRASFRVLGRNASLNNTVVVSTSDVTQRNATQRNATRRNATQRDATRLVAVV